MLGQRTDTTEAGIARRVFWRTLRIWAPQRSWNSQFAANRWDLPRSPETTRLVAQFCQGGRLMEFGCGVGALPRLLPAGTFSQYMGYDISDVAIARACEQTPPNCRFERMDMKNWLGDKGFSLIVIEETLYYLSLGQQRRFLRTCGRSLTSDGHILVIVHSARKHRRTVATCCSVCHVARQWQRGERLFLLLRPGPMANSPYCPCG